MLSKILVVALVGSALSVAVKPSVRGDDVIDISITDFERGHDEVENNGRGSGLFQGDEALDSAQLSFEEGLSDSDRTWIQDKSYRWTGGKFVYKIETSEFTDEDVKKIKDSLKEIETKSGGCVTIVEYTNEKNYALFKKKTKDCGCWSPVGMVYYESGPQTVSLCGGCMSKGTIQHEVFHALGVYHEQSRADRDKYLEVLWDNIQENNKNQFTKEGVNHDDIKYNVYSLMHYGPNYFSKNGKDTLRPKDGSKLKDAHELTYMDILKLVHMYKEENPACQVSNVPDESTFPDPRCADSDEQCPGWKKSCNDKSSYIPDYPKKGKRTSIANFCPRTCGTCGKEKSDTGNPDPAEATCIDELEGTCEEALADFCGVPGVKLRITERDTKGNVKSETLKTVDEVCNKTCGICQ